MDIYVNVYFCFPLFRQSLYANKHSIEINFEEKGSVEYHEAQDKIRISCKEDQKLLICLNVRNIRKKKVVLNKVFCLYEIPEIRLVDQPPSTDLGPSKFLSLTRQRCVLLFSQLASLSYC